LMALLYTSANYKPDKPKWRLLLPTSKPQPCDERKKYVARANGLFSGIFCAASWPLSQAFYYGGNAWVIISPAADPYDELPPHTIRIVTEKSFAPPAPPIERHQYAGAPWAVRVRLSSALGSQPPDRSFFRSGVWGDHQKRGSPKNADRRASRNNGWTKASKKWA